MKQIINIKCIKNNIFSGISSLGVSYEIAIDNNSKVFHRNWQYNGYGMAWTKWKEVLDFNGEFYLEEATAHYPKRERLNWGFGFDAVGSINNRIKLPKII